MQNQPTAHVEPLRFWQCACGHRDLSKSDYEHIISCAECETLARQIGEALDDLEKQVGRRRHFSSTS
jgi:hypothetical protein